MLHLSCSALILAVFSTPAFAQCATQGTNIKCLYVGPDRIQVPRADLPTIEPEAPAAEEEPRNSPAAIEKRFKRVSARRVPPIERSYEDGDILPAEVMVLMNPGRYGLPSPRDGWVYFTVGREIYRADLDDRIVLDFVNPHIQTRVTR